MIIQHEDLLQNPELVINHFESLGLKRNNNPFVPIDRNIGSSGKGRSALIDDLASVPKELLVQQIGSSV